MTWRIAAAWFQERRSRTTPDAESESGHDIIETRMQRILVVLVILAVGIGGLAALWIFRGCEISSLIDRYWPMETQSTPIQSIAYEGSGAAHSSAMASVSV